MTSKRENVWSADAEMMMQGFVIPVTSPEHLYYMTDYVLHVLQVKPANIPVTLTADNLIEGVNMYNSNNTPVSHVTINTVMDMIMMTFVRDDEMKSITDRQGVLSYVANLTYPDCSELGYTFFGHRNGKLMRIN